MAKKSEAAPKAPFITKHDIEEYLDLQERRKGLNREAKQLEKQAEEIEKKLEEFVRATGGKEKSVSRSGFVLAIKTAKGTVPWKAEYVKEMGNEAAEELMAAAPPREFFSVEKVA